jgi:hypothetical protein
LAGQQSLYWDWANAAEVLPVKQDRHVFNTVGKYPAVYGVDLGDGQDTFHLQRTMELIRRQATSGRIITVSYHFPGSRGDLAGVVDVGNTTVRPPFIARVEQMVELFRSLDADGARVPIIFRPFHEMNAPWNLIWWGKNGAANLQALWKEVWNRFHNRPDGRNIHNILWMFSANAWLDSGSLVDPPNAYYPGHAFVDMLGADIYIEAGYQWRQAYHDDLRALGAGRPIAITESGRLPDFPAMRVLQPHWVYWLTWYDRYQTVNVENPAEPNPENTPTRYATVAGDPAVVWSLPDITVRDVSVDTGLFTPSPEFIIDGAGPHWWYESADIKVDANPMSPLDLTVPTNFEMFPGDSPVRNATNRVYVRVHNRGPGVATNVKVKCLWADASAGLPMLPPDFWQQFPEAWTGSSPWNAVDPSAPYVVIASIPPRSSRVARIDWPVPSTAANHSCLLAMATVVGDPIQRQDALSADREIQPLVRNDKRVALRNLHVVSGPGPFKWALNFHATTPMPRPGELAIDTHQLSGGRVTVSMGESPLRLLRTLNGTPSSFRRMNTESSESMPAKFELEVTSGLRRTTSVEHFPRISGIELWADRPTTVDIEWFPPENVEPGSVHRVRCLQLVGESVQGGSTFEIRIPKSSVKGQ